jgi:hypothetical protein
MEDGLADLSGGVVRRRASKGARGWRTVLIPAFWAAPALALTASAGAGQTDYYNLDKSRPLRVEDAYATERYAFELQVAPLTLSGGSGVLHYAPSLELKYGIFSGVEMSAGYEAHVTRHEGETSRGPGEIELSALYNLNTETLKIPALGVRVTGHLPLEDGQGPSLELKGTLTRVLGGSWRTHLNGAAVLGEDAEERWWSGLALDYVLPFRSLLLMGETYYASPRTDDADARVHSAAGFRYQLTPRSSLDLGAGRDWTGTERRDWRVTLGVTTAEGFRALMPIR